ncbi:MAG: glycosyltransferase family 9 protein [Flavobacteriales bacterium]|nr:glycosyltransferase family 9 protein [Flavobacteriales bacterium]MCX7768822.1 glycosyltransferase family 9 protein [Flavobacteriales bacterium]MDW8410404.1 glycosyltransferase family 9 protein [Flavobacteriales bacterium]
MNIPKPKKILLIQTAFPGDVVLSLGAAETLHGLFPEAAIHYLVREGCETILEGHPFIVRTWAWKKSSWSSFWKVVIALRREKFDVAIVFQRFARSGLLALLSGSACIVGYAENPFSPFFQFRIHYFNKETKMPAASHEWVRCCKLVSLPWNIPETHFSKPKLYPPTSQVLSKWGLEPAQYVVCAPGSVWFTKRMPLPKWEELVRRISTRWRIVFLGGREEQPLCEALAKVAGVHRSLNLAGATSFLESAAIMEKAVLSIVQDSAPLHLASAVNAPVCAVFGSTVPAFGFGPLSTVAFVVETSEHLECRPCGLHGHTRCPKLHFRCMETISLDSILEFLYRHAGIQR